MDLSQLILSMFSLTNAAQRMTDQPSAAAAPPSMSPLLAETRDLRMSRAWCEELTTWASPDQGPGQQPGAGRAQESPQTGDGAQPGGSGRVQLTWCTRPYESDSDNDPDDDIVMMSPDGGDPGGRPGQDHPEVDEGEAGEEAVKVEGKRHHSHWVDCHFTTVLHVSLKY